MSNGAPARSRCRPLAYGFAIDPHRAQLRLDHHPVHLIDVKFPLDHPLAVGEAVVADIPSTVIPDEWYPEQAAPRSISEQIHLWGRSASGLYRDSYDQWGLLHHFNVIEAKGEVALYDRIDKLPNSTTTVDEAVAVATSIADRLRELLAATVVHRLTATGRVARQPSLRKLWSIEGEVGGQPIELTASVTKKDTLLDLTSWKFGTLTVEFDGRLGREPLRGKARGDTGSLRTKADNEIAWSPGRLSALGVNMWSDGTNVRGEHLATWFKPNRDHQDGNRGTLALDSPIVALGAEAGNEQLIALIGAHVLARTGVYKIARG